MQSLCLFKACVAKFWLHQDVKYDFMTDLTLTGIGNRSVREAFSVYITKLYYL